MRIYIILVTWAVVGCTDPRAPATTPEAAPAAAVAQTVPADFLAELQTIPPDTDISLSQGHCKACPKYAVRIDATGAVRFDGWEHLADPGQKLRQVDPAGVLALLHEAGELGFFNIDEALMESTCGGRRTDAHTVVLKIWARGDTRVVTDDYACEDGGLRTRLRSLEKHIIELAVDPKWLRRARR